MPETSEETNSSKVFKLQDLFCIFIQDNHEMPMRVGNKTYIIQG